MISGINSLLDGGNPRSAPSQDVNSTEDFFQIVYAQLRGQNPLEPVDETQFMGQIAQFNQLEEQTTTNDRLASLLMLQESIAALQQMTQGAALIGKSVEYTDPNTGTTQQGIVQAVRVQDGLVVADVDGTSVPFGWFQSVTNADDD